MLHIFKVDEGFVLGLWKKDLIRNWTVFYLFDYWSNLIIHDHCGGGHGARQAAAPFAYSSTIHSRFANFILYTYHIKSNKLSN